MAIARKSAGDILLEKRYITEDQLNQAREVQRTQNGDLGRILQDLGYATERDVVEARATAEGLNFIDLTKHKADPSAVNVVPEHVVRKHNVLPMKKDGNKLWVAMIDPRNVVAIDDVRMVSRLQVLPLAAVPTDLQNAINTAYNSGGGSGAPSDITPGPALNLTPNRNGTSPANNSPGGKEKESAAGIMIELNGLAAPGVLDDEDDRALPDADMAPIIRMANAILVEAIDAGASDIHIEPDRRNVRIRNRIDGVLHQVMSVPKHIQAPLISRYKIMSDMNIAERRVPQDGRIPLKHNGKDYDMRVSCLPSMFGEKIVMRILDKSSVLIGLNKLGLRPEVQALCEDLTIQPNGMFLVTGPTGSGKTTTLYSVLNKINTIEKNIITVEDPIEYQLGGITQVGINKKAGLNFGNALRSFLRQDPDVIMVGEMRDLETAEIAIEAALTGHLVLSTLHTNDAPSATMRLADMGVEPFLIAATVIGILAQRLARRICSNCKEPYSAKASDLVRFGFPQDNPDSEVTLFRGVGCDVCRGTGYKGRLGIHELMVPNDEIRELIVRRAALADIKAASLANGMKEMKEDGLIKVLRGETTPDEVMRVVFTAGA